MDSSIGVALISSGTAIIVSLIAAWSSSGKAVANAVAPKDKEIEHQKDAIAEQGVLIQRLREKIVELRGDPDEP